MSKTDRSLFSRRAFLATGASCMAHVAWMAAGSSVLTRRLWAAEPRGQVVAQEPWGRLEEVAEGVWALISTPLEDPTTLCNGGIVAGESGVLVVESFGSNRGAAWVAEQARRLTGRWPSHVVLTHYHGDHTGGLVGLDEEGADSPAFHMTFPTRDLVAREDADQDGGPPPARARILAGAELIDPSPATELDLGGRVVRVTPLQGHTASDVIVHLPEDQVVFCGDLVWNEMFPNYVDAIPSRLSRSVRTLMSEAREGVYVPGHGPLADRAAMHRYLSVIDLVEEEARRAFGRGISAARAAESFELPESLGEWYLFNPRYYERAFLAWEKDLRQGA